MRRIFASRASTLMLAILSPLCASVVAAHATDQPLIVHGSTTFTRQLMDTQKAVIESESKQALTVIPNKTRPGLIGLLEGRAHMAMVSSSLEHEIDALRKVRPDLPYERLQAHVISTTRVAVMVHPSNQVRKAALNQMKRVLLGQIANWRQLGGANLPIRVVLVGGGGGVTRTVESELLDNHPAVGPHIIFVRTPVQLVQIVEQEPSTIGFGQLALSKQKSLPELITERPIEQVLSMVTLGAPTPAMESVIKAARRAAQSVM
jgi:phosphate transport system substrate-binding protein